MLGLCQCTAPNKRVLRNRPLSQGEAGRAACDVATGCSVEPSGFARRVRGCSARSRRWRVEAGADSSRNASCCCHRGYTTRAIFCAVAPMACCGPRRARLERKDAPKAESARATDWAAWRNAWGARLPPCSVRERTTLPPELSGCGASPSQEQQCFTVGNVPLSVPTSARRGCARDAELPGTATRSTPGRRATDVRAVELG